MTELHSVIRDALDQRRGDVRDMHLMPIVLCVCVHSTTRGMKAWWEGERERERKK